MLADRYGHGKPQVDAFACCSELGPEAGVAPPRSEPRMAPRGRQPFSLPAAALSGRFVKHLPLINRPSAGLYIESLLSFCPSAHATMVSCLRPRQARWVQFVT